jgi:hypothetical protein
MAGAHVQIYLWTFDRGWPQKYIIQKCMSGIYDVNVEGNSLVMCSWVTNMTSCQHIVNDERLTGRWSKIEIQSTCSMHAMLRTPLAAQDGELCGPRITYSDLERIEKVKSNKPVDQINVGRAVVTAR